MRRHWWLVLLIAPGAAIGGCRAACHPPAASCCRSRCCPPGSGALAQRLQQPAVSVDAPASSELVPLPVRPVFGWRLDGRQTGELQAAAALAAPPVEEVPAPQPSRPSGSSSLRLRRRDNAAAAAH